MRKLRTQKKLRYTFKSDILFKMLFVKYPYLLKRLVAALLDIPRDSITELRVINAEIPPEDIGSKYCRLDINMDVDKKKVNIEIQVRNEGNYCERVMMYWARICGASLPSGNDYAELPQTIIISIIDFILFDWEDVHSEFRVCEMKHHKTLSDKQVYHFFELKKLKGIDQLESSDERDMWLALFNARTEEDLKKLISIGGEIMTEAVEAYKKITATEEYKNLELMRWKRELLEAQVVYAERKRGEEAANAKWAEVVAKKNKDITKKDNDIAKKEKDIAKKDKDIAKRDNDIAKKDAELLQKDALIAELQSKLKMHH